MTTTRSSKPAPARVDPRRAPISPGVAFCESMVATQFLSHAYYSTANTSCARGILIFPSTFCGYHNCSSCTYTAGSICGIRLNLTFSRKTSQFLQKSYAFHNGKIWEIVTRNRPLKTIPLNLTWLKTHPMRFYGISDF